MLLDILQWWSDAHSPSNNIYIIYIYIDSACYICLIHNLFSESGVKTTASADKQVIFLD